MITLDLTKIYAKNPDTQNYVEVNWGDINVFSRTGIDTSDATAHSFDILSGKTAYARGIKIEGSYVPLDTSDATATANVILKNETAYVNGVKIAGTIESLERTVYMPSTTNQTISANQYLSGDQIIMGDANLRPEFIKKDVLLFNTTGTYEGVDTSDATATADDILLGETAYIASGKVTGIYVPLDTSDATAISSDIKMGKTAYVDGAKITGDAYTRTSQVNAVAEGLIDGTAHQLQAGFYNGIAFEAEPNLLSENIKDGVTIYGVTGTYTGPPIGAGIEIDFANKTYKKLGRTDYDNMACFGDRKLCYVDRSTSGTNVEIIEDFSTVPDMKNIMVQQPKVYYKVIPIATRTLSNGTMVVDKCQYWVSDKPDWMQLHPAFVRGGTERNFIYHGAYPINYASPGPDIDPKNSEQDTTTTNSRAIYTGSCLISRYGYQPRAYQTRDWYRKGAVGQDTYYNQNMSIETIYSASLEQLLMLIEYGPNFQTNFAAGWTNLTDNSSYNCSPLSGACFTNGNKSMARGNNSLIQGTDVLVHGTRNASGTYSYSYRGVENFFGGIWEWIDGINLRGTGSGEKVYIISPDSLAYADDTTTNYLDTGIILPNTNDWIKSFAYSPNYDWILMPGEVGGSGDSSLPIGDYFYQATNLDSNSWRCALLGGFWDSGLIAGPFCWSVAIGSGSWYRDIGARLMMLGDNENS